MTSVWVVEYCGIDNAWTEGVFSTKEKAEAYREEANKKACTPYYEVEEYKVDALEL